MNSALWVGAILAVLGGALQGAFAVPMKYAKKWNHENIWFVFVLTGLLLLPWAVTIATVPSLAEVYRTASPQSLAMIVVFGIGWGIGATLVGIAFRMLGISLGFAIVLGLSALLGSLVPFLMQPAHSDSQTRIYALGTCVMLLGIVLVAAAGAMRDRANQAAGGPGEPGKKHFVTGLLIAIAAGVLSSFMSFAIAFSSQLVETARHLGASTVWASNVVLAPTTTGGSLANFVYCAVMMRRNRSGKLLWQTSMKSHWVYGIAMGTFWYGGLAIYGLAAQRIGSVEGWLLFIGAMILSSTIAGFLTKEWSSAGRGAKLLLCGGSLTIFLALIVVGMAHNQ
jgi:L-rhamnose-H+ transport protein